MKTTVFTLMTAFVLSTTTCLAQPGGRNHYQNNGSRQQYTERNMNHGGHSGIGQNHGRSHHFDDMYVMSGRGHHVHGRTHGVRVVAPPPAPRVVERVVYTTPCAPVPPPPPAPVPHHTVHVTPAGVVAGAVIGTVIGAILCQ